MREIFSQRLYSHAIMLFAAVVCLMLARRSARAEISLTILPTAPGDDRALVLGISGDGRSVVGNAGTLLIRRAVVWQDAGSSGGGNWPRVDLPTLPASPSNSAQGVSADGSLIAGNSLNTPTLWRRASNGDWAIERVFSDARPGVANAVVGSNAPGQSATVAGFGAPPGGGPFRAFVATPPAPPVDLGVVGGGSTTQAFGLSGSGAVAIGSGTNSSGNATAWRWRAGDAELAPLAVPTFVATQARAVSADGGVIGGFASSGSGATLIEPVLWEGADATPRVLARLGAEPHARVLALSADGSVAAGVSYDGAATSDPATAVVWRIAGDGGERVPVTLASVFADANIAVGQLRFQTVNGVSWDGERIAGTGLDEATGRTFAFVATIPAPGAAGALALGLVMLGARRRR